MSTGSGSDPISGDADLAALGAVLAEPARAKMLLALGDGRALPATTLAAEAGVAASTASAHLGRLLDAGLVAVRQQGRYRYYQLSGPQVGELIEVMARISPPARVTSLREGTRAHALRRARTCYDHLAGRLGVSVFSALLDQQLIVGGDGRHHPERARADRLSSRGHDVAYHLSERGQERLDRLGVTLPARAPGEIPLRYCIDWTEQAHHLSGAVGRAFSDRLFELEWIVRVPRTRAVRLTPAGEAGLREQIGLAWR